MEMLERLEKKTLLCSMMPVPNSPETEIMDEILRISQKNMNDEISKYMRISKEYREYIEMWIHEVKTPIAAAKLIMQNQDNEVSSSVMEELTSIEDYVEQALYYARSNDVSKDYMVKTCNLQDIVNEVIRRNRKYFIQRKIGLQLNNLDQVIYTDSKWVEFILHQVVGNAIKYTNEDANIQFYAETRSNQVILYIEDNGVGISEKDLPRVFEKGYTGKNGRQLKTATGMGLYLCKKLCTKLNLAIAIISKEGEGTTVHIVFPVSKISFLYDN